MKSKSISDLILDWARENIKKGKYVICDIYEGGCSFRTLVRYKIGDNKKRSIVTFHTPAESCKYSKAAADTTAKWNDYDGMKFEIGKVYEATTYYGSKHRYKVIKRAESGYITFEEVFSTPYCKPKRFARIPLKGWEHADERVTIQKGTFGRVCWTGGYDLYARDLVAEPNE